jgi:hypothetical protein
MAIVSHTIIDAFSESGVPKPELERRLAEYALGIIYALENSEITVEQAMGDLFNLDFYRAAKGNRLSKTLIELLEWGMELEDVEAISSAASVESFAKIRQLARGILAKR